MFSSLYHLQKNQKAHSVSLQECDLGDLYQQKKNKIGLEGQRLQQIK
jgi:hypothetical protein